MIKAAERLARSEPFDDLLGYHLRRVSALAMADLAEALAPLKLKPAHASILFVIASNAGITQSDVGKTLGILRANMAPLIASLVKRGMIKREAMDGRSHAMRLSALGQTICRQARDITQDHEVRLFGGLSRAARARMIDQLHALWSTRPPARRSDG
jgi:DNA-binding MarR family transcriptional regulator